MARLRLGRYEVEECDLPRLCMRCGALATHTKTKTFAWHPAWVSLLVFIGLLPYVIVALILTKRMTVRVPMCDKHKWHWGGRVIIALVSLVVVIALVTVLAASANPSQTGSVAVGAGVLGFVLWVIFIALLFNATIKPEEITDRNITLVGVNKEFVEAVEDEREGYDDEEDDYDWPRRRRDHRRRRGQDDEDDDRERRQPPSDAIQRGEDER